MKKDKNQMKQAEHTEQSKLITFCWSENTPKQLSNIFAIPNGAYVSKREAVKLKREGLKAGVPDLCLPVRSHNREHQMLWVEMKRPDGKGRVSVDQSEFIEKAQREGHCGVVAESAVEAIIQIYRYCYDCNLSVSQARDMLNREMVCP